jgi:hypothetical protein
MGTGAHGPPTGERRGRLTRPTMAEKWALEVITKKEFLEGLKIVFL